MSLPAIDLNIYGELEDPEFRRAFFRAESSGEIARQLIACRKRRGLLQNELAEKMGCFQPALSRFEQADYHNRSFRWLLKLADALDCRVRVVIEPWEDVRDEYR